MIPGIFNNISQKLKCLDKLKIPLETIDIIKSFAFYKINSPPYYKIISKTKEPLLDKFIRIKYIPGICNNGHWALGFLSPYPNEYTQLQAINCISCGEYKPLEAGHYIAVSKSTKLRYDLRNIHGQCRACNGHPLYGNLVNYRKGLISRCGLESVEWLHNNK